MLHGLTDPVTGLSMGQTAENLAHRFLISRERMDAYALESHRRLARAQDEGRLGEITTIYAGDGAFYDHDEGVRRDTDMAGLARLKPAFDPPFGLVTAGNSAQVTDGAAWLLLASETAVQRYRLPVLGRIVDSAWVGVEPGQMGLGPVHAMAPILKRQGLGTADIDFWEINEAFAAQVLACLEAWQSPEYCREELGLATPFAAIDPDRLNVDGGAVAIGHPVGTSGARIVLHLLHVLERNNARRGMAASASAAARGGRCWSSAARGCPMAHDATRTATGGWNRTATGSPGSPSTGRSESVNALSREALEELARLLDEIARQQPAGVVIRSGKPNGFIAGADVTEFTDLADEGAALALIERGQQILGRLERLPVPTVCPDSRLLPGRGAGTGARLPLPDRRRRPGNAARPSRGEARHPSRFRRDGPPDRPHRPAPRPRPDADRQERRCPPGAQARPGGLCRAGPPPGKRRPGDGPLTPPPPSTTASSTSSPACGSCGRSWPGTCAARWQSAPTGATTPPPMP